MTVKRNGDNSKISTKRPSLAEFSRYAKVLIFAKTPRGKRRGGKLKASA